MCIGGIWYVNESIPGYAIFFSSSFFYLSNTNRLGCRTNGTIIIGPTPVVINGTLVLSNGTVLVVSPGGSITVNGTVVLGGSVVIVFSGSQRPEDGEIIPILTATNVTGGVTGIEIEGEPECGTASATPVTTETTFGALISVSGCKSRYCLRLNDT